MGMFWNFASIIIYRNLSMITKGADNTVSNVGRLAREGMRETDKTILKIMMNEE